MEGLKNKRLSFPAKNFFIRAIAALGVTMALVACNSGGGGGSGVTVGVGINGCQNCGTITSPVVLATYQSQSPSANLVFSNMNIIAQATGIVPNASGNNYRNYQGPIAIQGTLDIKATEYDRYSACVVPAGRYAVSTYTVGQMGMAGGDIVVPLLMATNGSYTVEMQIDGPLNTMAGGLLTDGGQRLYARVAVVKVNGQVCSSDFYGIFN